MRSKGWYQQVRIGGLRCAEERGSDGGDAPKKWLPQRLHTRCLGATHTRCSVSNTDLRTEVACLTFSTSLSRQARCPHPPLPFLRRVRRSGLAVSAASAEPLAYQQPADGPPVTQTITRPCWCTQHWCGYGHRGSAKAKPVTLFDAQVPSLRRRDRSDAQQYPNLGCIESIPRRYAPFHITTATTAALLRFLGRQCRAGVHLCHSNRRPVVVYEPGGAPICSDQLMRALGLSQPPP